MYMYMCTCMFPSQNELQYQDVVQLTVPGEVMEGPEGTQGTTISQ